MYQYTKEHSYGSLRNIMFYMSIDKALSWDFENTLLPSSAIIECSYIEKIDINILIGFGL